MKAIDWLAEVENRREELLRDLQELLNIESVLDEQQVEKDAPLGKPLKEALDFMLNLGEKDGFTTKNVGNIAGHIEWGEGDGLIGILGHLDVVPAGDGWSTDPFKSVIKDGKIYARGAIDDKGPTMAAYYALKIVKELALPLKKRVRVILGTDEESEWRCVDHYFQHEEMPEMGFAPDADFPIIYAEKGIVDFDLVQNLSSQEQSNGNMTLISFEAGQRYNMVPDHAKAILDVKNNKTKLLQNFNQFIRQQGLQAEYYVDAGYLIIELEGVSAHGMEPNHGKNAGLLLAQFLSTMNLDAKGQHFISKAVAFFFGDSRGRALGVSYQDEITGELTINVGKMIYNEVDGGKFGLNLRYPVTFNVEEGIEKIKTVCQEAGFLVQNLSDSKPHYVPKESELIRKLSTVYEEQTGEKASLLSIGGGTYARALEAGVAFGALFPGRPDVAHQKDEYIELEDLFKATAIYAQAIYELAR